MENNNFSGHTSQNSTNDKVSPDHTDLFEAQNFFEDNQANGTTKEVFDRRSIIDRKNLVELFIGRFGINWVSLIVIKISRSAFY